MAFTRFHDDPARIEKQLQETTGLGRYMLNVPGNNGDTPCFMEDPFIRMQKWGANLMTNTVNLESDLFGLTRKTNKDTLSENNYVTKAVYAEKKAYPVCAPSTDQSRVTMPAWMFRDLEQVNWSILPLNPQENTCFPFQNNLNTRLIEKDTFVTKMPAKFIN
jgi:hypothetical protein